MLFTGLRLPAFLAAAACVAGCSLVSLKTPERPLSTRDLNARILTREFSYHFIAAVGQCADDIGASETDAGVLTSALRWKIAAATESQRAASRISPMMSLLDTWALAAQMRAFLSHGQAGGELFGSHQETAVAVAVELDGEAQALARRLTASGEFSEYQRFVDAYTREHPLTNLEFVRPSVVELWSEAHGGGARLVDSMGTITEAMTDFSDRLKMSSDALALQTLWRTQLALREAGYSGTDIRAALRQLDERLAKASAAAENAPQLLHDAIAEVRRSVLDVLERVDSSSARMIAALRTEREALAADVRIERQAIVTAADAQRRALAQDAATIAERVVRSSGDEARRLAREVLALMIVLAVVVLGLPFAAGYLVGRARRG
jgi:DNA-binding transcriptional MerR regulator